MSNPSGFLTSRSRSLLEASIEVVLSLIPIVVIALALIYMGKSEKIFVKPEWSFAAALFFVQSIVRVLSAMANNHRSVYGPKVVLFSALLLVFGLVPTLMALAFIILSQEEGRLIPIWLQFYQIGIYILSAFVYMITVAVSSHFSKNH